ncbi:hypothetical protein [Microaceticoccus formicicus]|uniref:hypothetical protein n=1 Tax=Microaceticoccus formicicus TaxID=3118105 RepID=UPI003CD009E2|nr:hypothetical protein VZL98_04905 [Peptoniphilaceae bacterium AMB_02]
MIRMSKNAPFSKQELIDLLNLILEKDEIWQRNTTIRFIESKQEKLFKDVDKLLEEQRILNIKYATQYKKWKQIDNEIKKIYAQIDEIGDCWKVVEVGDAKIN